MSLSRLKALILAGRFPLQEGRRRPRSRYHFALADPLTAIDVHRGRRSRKGPRARKSAPPRLRDADISSSTSPRPRGARRQPATPRERWFTALIAHCGDRASSGICGVKASRHRQPLDKEYLRAMFVARTIVPCLAIQRNSLRTYMAAPAQCGRGYLSLPWAYRTGCAARRCADRRHPHASRKMAVREGGRDAVTHY